MQNKIVQHRVAYWVARLGMSLALGLPLVAFILPSAAQDAAPLPASNVPPTFAVPVVSLTPASAKPVHEPSGLADIIRAKFPLAVQYKEFGLGWRELNYEGNNFFTKGETVWLNDDEYLVAYKPAPRAASDLNNMEYVTSVTNNANRFAPTDRFEFTLLLMNRLIPLVTNGNTALRSFDPLHEAARSGPALDAANFSAAFNQGLALIYLRKIYDAVTAYNRAYLAVMPPLDTAFAARKALLPFAENTVIFTQPGTNQPFKANPLFSNRKLAHLRGQNNAVLFYEAEPAPDKLRAVLLYNGAVRRVDEKTWVRLKKISLLD